MLKYSEKFLWLKIFTAQKYQKGKRKRQQSYNQQTFFHSCGEQFGPYPKHSAVVRK